MVKSRAHSMNEFNGTINYDKEDRFLHLLYPGINYANTYDDI